jgi:hypothetical protein
MWARGRFTLTDILFGRQAGSGDKEIEFQEIETGGRKFFFQEVESIAKLIEKALGVLWG